MSQTVQSDLLTRIESIARQQAPGAKEDMRQLLTTIVHNLTVLSPGGNLLQIGGPKAGASAPPVGVTHSVSGANGVATVNISNPAGAQPGSIWHQVRYSPLASFTQSSTVMEPTQATSVTIPQSGVKAFYQVRSSFDKVNWSAYKFPTSGPTAVDAGLVESSAMSSGAAFNQTNFALVQSQSLGSGAAISIGGTSSPYSPYTAVKGSKQSLRPSATIVGANLQSSTFIGWDGSTYQVKATLADVLADDLEPVGKVSLGSGQTGGGTVTGGNGGRMTAV
jgi:hypothetical protein